MHARMVWAPDLAVMSARFPFKDSMLWMAARDADAARNDTFFPVRGGEDTSAKHGTQSSVEDDVGRRWQGSRGSSSSRLDFLLTCGRAAVA